MAKYINISNFAISDISVKHDTKPNLSVIAYVHGDTIFCLDQRIAKEHVTVMCPDFSFNQMNLHARLN